MRAPWGDMREALQLPASTGLRPRTFTTGWLASLTPTQVAVICRATGVAPHLVRATTIEAVRATISAPNRSTGPSVDSLLWLTGRRSRFCPHCLATNGGRWYLRWRLRWVYACVTHRCLLADACPACWRIQRLAEPPAGHVPTPTRCQRPRSGLGAACGDRCGADLTATAASLLKPADAVLQAQSTFLRCLRTGRATFGMYAAAPVTTAALLSDVAALGGRILAYAPHDELARLVGPAMVDSCSPGHPDLTANHRTRVTADSTASASAVAATAAWIIMSAPDIPSAGSQLRWLIEDNRRNGIAVRASTVGWGRHISQSLIGAQLSALTPWLSPSDELRHRTCTTSPRMPSPAAAAARARSVPALLWPHYSLAFTTPGVGHVQLRAALSAAVILVGSTLTLAQAAEVLGSVTFDRALSRILQSLARSPAWPRTQTVITAIADHLDRQGAPIDYHRRRAMPCHDLLPASIWGELCRAAGVDQGRAQRHRIARCWLQERMTGLPAHHSVWAEDTAAFRTKVADFPLLLTTDLVAAVDSYADDYLKNHGIGDEPVHWCPDERAISTLSLASAHQGSIDVSELHRRVRSDRPRSCAALARHFAVDVTLLRHLLDANPVPSLDLDASMAGGALAAAARRLPEHRFREMYLARGVSLAGLASYAGVSRQTVSRLGHEYGVPLRPVGRPGRRWLNASSTRSTASATSSPN